MKRLRTGKKLKRKRQIIGKIAVISIMISLNWSGLFAVGKTLAYFNDVKSSLDNSYTAATLDFSLASASDFSPNVTPSTATTTRDINMINNGILNFQYEVSETNATGTLCNYLNLEAKVNGTSVYTGPLIGFDFNAGNFSTSTVDPNWQFLATLMSDDSALQNQTCTFDFVFDGTQIGGAGFSDQEIISNTINSGTWMKVVINKVYYDVDLAHGSEGDNEWVELYNPLGTSIDLSNWEICDNNSCDNLSNTIPAGGFAVITDKSTTWDYWDIPSGVIKIALDNKIGDGLNNTADMLALKNTSDTIIDQMNWGTPTSTWPNYNINVWNPGIPDAPQGHILARVPTGFDTDQPTDFKDLGLPSVTVLVPNGGEIWHIGVTSTIQWAAANSNGPDNALSIDIWYSKDSGSTWANIVRGTENDDSYDWRVPLCLDNGSGGCYYTVSRYARIKVVARGPENFMVQNWDGSDADFCPPIDYGLLTPEEIVQLEQLLSEGIASYGDIATPEATETTAGGNGLINNVSSTEALIATGTVSVAGNATTTTEENATSTDQLANEVAGATQETPSENPTDENSAIEEQPAVIPEDDIVISEIPAPVDNEGNADNVGNVNSNIDSSNTETSE